jgi:hypothetical protein
VIAKTPRRSNDNMGAIDKRAAFLAHIHASDAGCHFGAGGRVKPRKFKAHLDSQFARGGNHDSHWIGACREAVFPSKQGRGHGETESNRFARSRLRGHQEVSLTDIPRKDGALHSSERRITLFLKRPRE